MRPGSKQSTSTNADETEGSLTEDWSSRRSDARKNRERIIDAAIEVFTEYGLGATIPQVAERAGVGKATVYRSFPTKADLVAALGQLHVEWAVERFATAEQEAHHDAYAALEAALVDVADRLIDDRLMADTLNHLPGNDQFHVFTGVDKIIERAVAQGSLRADAVGIDLQIFMVGVTQALLDLGIRDTATWHRYTRLSLAALRPD